MVRVDDCHAGVLGSNSGGPKDFSLGIALMVSEVFYELMQSNSVTLCAQDLFTLTADL